MLSQVVLPHQAIRAGGWRVDASADAYSLFGAFDRTSVRVIQTVFDSNELTFLSGTYERPLGTDGLKAIITGSYADSTPGPPQNLNLPTNSVSATATLLYPIRRARIGNLSGAGRSATSTARPTSRASSSPRIAFARCASGSRGTRSTPGAGVNLADVELSQGLKGLGASPFGIRSRRAPAVAPTSPRSRSMRVLGEVARDARELGALAWDAEEVDELRPAHVLAEGEQELP